MDQVLTSPVDLYSGSLHVSEVDFFFIFFPFRLIHSHWTAEMVWTCVSFTIRFRGFTYNGAWAVKVLIAAVDVVDAVVMVSWYGNVTDRTSKPVSVVALLVHGLSPKTVDDASSKHVCAMVVSAVPAASGCVQ